MNVLRRLGLSILVTWCWLNSAGTIRAEQEPAGPDRPNILWITCEDISPNLGCYGDTYAVTPHLDALAQQAVRFSNAFAPIGVCAPARSCLITGLYPPSIGTQHMRCQGRLPAGVECFPASLRRAGYYCTNNVKTDYNFQHARDTWDESSKDAHWRKRKPGQPFFSVFNFTSCHESQIRLPENQYRQRTVDFTERERHDPARVTVPPYHPDTPEVRRDWARYADMITYMDREASRVLAELNEDGLSENTIVFFFSDHGAGMPRSKRWLYDSSLRVPLLIRFPPRFARYAPARAGEISDRLVSFVDFGPTVLSLAGVPIPQTMQGVAFLGDQAASPREYVFGYRDRMDERYDLIRAVRDKRYKYIRNFMPQLPYFHDQHISYMYEMPTMKVWQRLADEGQLTGAPALFMAAHKAPEELYDTQRDPHEIDNLASKPESEPILERLRAELERWQLEIGDLGLLPEADLRTRWGDEPPYAAYRARPESYPLNRILAAAVSATRFDPAREAFLIESVADTDPAVRYWAAVGLGNLSLTAQRQRRAEPYAELVTLLEDQAPPVQVAAADALVRWGTVELVLPVLRAGLGHENEWVRLQAINVADRLKERPATLRELLDAARNDTNQYVVRVAEHATRD